MDRAVTLWRAVTTCSSRLITRRLRLVLLGDVLESLEMACDPVPNPDLCVGDVLLALGRERTARTWLEGAVHQGPCISRLNLLLGDACWLTDSRGPAHSAYSRGLLLDPTLERWRSVAWQELRRRIRSAGGVRTALEMWAEGALPVPPLATVGRPHHAVRERWEALAAAEEAAAHRRHGDVIRHRIRLRDLDPDVFTRYMARLEG